MTHINRFAHIDLIPERLLPDYGFDMQNDVAFLHHAMHMPDLMLTPGALPQDRIDLRVKLILEEGISELRRDLVKNDFVNVVDAHIDTMVVTLGALVEMGADFSVPLKEALETQLVEAYQRAKHDGAPLPSVVQIASLQWRFTNPVQQQLAHILTLESAAGIPDMPTFDRASAERALAANSSNLEGLKVSFAQGSADISVIYLGNIFFNALASLTEMGVDAQPFFNEIQRANLSKVDENGLPIHSRGEELDNAPKGKFLKSKLYVKPDLRRVFETYYAGIELPPVTTHYALLSQQGTAMSETVLTVEEFTPANQQHIKDNAPADWNGEDFVDVSQNEAIIS